MKQLPPAILIGLDLMVQWPKIAGLIGEAVALADTGKVRRWGSHDNWYAVTDPFTKQVELVTVTADGTELYACSCDAPAPCRHTLATHIARQVEAQQSDPVVTE